ncbi:MAG: hypothetical protein U0271_47985 [Polyangiaceae bacterium]
MSIALETLFHSRCLAARLDKRAQRGFLILGIVVDQPPAFVHLPEVDTHQLRDQTLEFARRPRSVWVECVEHLTRDEPVGGLPIRIRETSNPEPCGFRSDAQKLRVVWGCVVHAYPVHDALRRARRFMLRELP